MVRKILKIKLLFAMLSVACGAFGAVGDSSWQDAFALEIAAAIQNGSPMPQLTARHPTASLEDAYAIQSIVVAETIGTTEIGGFKAAIVMQPNPAHPLIALIPKGGIHEAADPPLIDLSEDSNRHLETEIGYRFSQSISTPVENVAQLKEHVDAIVAVLEVPGHQSERSKPTGKIDIVAWNINAKEIIVGMPIRKAKIDPDMIDIILTKDGEVINTANGAMAVDGQWETLLRAVNRVVRLGYTIESGHIFTNGALGKIIRVEPGDYAANFGPLGEIKIRVD